MFVCIRHFEKLCCFWSNNESLTNLLPFFMHGCGSSESRTHNKRLCCAWIVSRYGCVLSAWDPAWSAKPVRVGVNVTAVCVAAQTFSNIRRSSMVRQCSQNRTKYYCDIVMEVHMRPQNGRMVWVVLHNQWCLLFFALRCLVWPFVMWDKNIVVYPECTYEI